jgi:hypothetical protein
MMELENLFNKLIFSLKLSGMWFHPPEGYRGILLKILAFYNFAGPFLAAVTGFYCFTSFDIGRVIDIMGALSPTIETNVRFLSFYFRKRELEDMIRNFRTPSNYLGYLN